MYEPNAIVVLPDGTQLTDSGARREMLTGLIAGGSGMPGVPRKVLIADDIALTATSHEIPSGATGDQATTVETAEISRRQADGSWRVVVDAPALS